VLVYAENFAVEVGRNETCEGKLCSDLLLMNRALMDNINNQLDATITVY